MVHEFVMDISCISQGPTWMSLKWSMPGDPWVCHGLNMHPLGTNLDKQTNRIFSQVIWIESTFTPWKPKCTQNFLFYFLDINVYNTYMRKQNEAKWGSQLSEFCLFVFCFVLIYIILFLFLFIFNQLFSFFLKRIHCYILIPL